jgi:hypothetical protein
MRFADLLDTTIFTTCTLNSDDHFNYQISLNTFDEQYHLDLTRAEFDLLKNNCQRILDAIKNLEQE